MVNGRKVVVVMPAYNAAQTLVKTHQEVLDQGIVDLVVVVDDSSRDQTTAIAKTLPRTLVHTHPANRVPFWLHACDEGRRNACKVVVTMESVLCGRGSGWACNELGIYVAERRADLADRFPPEASFAAACALEFEAGCLNARQPPGGRSYVHRPPSLGDYELLLESKALPRHPTAAELLEVACAHGWTDGCMSKGYLFTLSDLVPHDAARGVRGFEQACAGGLAGGCVEAAGIYGAGADGVTADPARAERLRARGCALGVAEACPKP